jgi:hypothetical protein
MAQQASLKINARAIVLSSSALTSAPFKQLPQSALTVMLDPTMGRQV